MNIRGLSNSEKYTYSSWRAMRHRCDSPNTNGYHNYGGAGVTYCKRWTKFENFLADMGSRPEGTTLDRYVEGHDETVDGKLNYGPTTCRWATLQQQSDNRATTIMLEYQGVTQCLSSWAKQLGLPKTTVCKRFSQGMSAADCLSTVNHVDKITRRLTYDGKQLTISEWAEELGISKSLIRGRLRQGWDVARALTEPAKR